MRKPINNIQQHPINRIRLCQALWTGKKAGAETYVLKLAQGLAIKRPDFKIRIVFFTKAHELGDTLKKKEIDFVELHCKSGYDFLGMLRFLWEVLTNRYTIIHTHESTAISLLLLKAFPSLKSIYTEHSSLLPCGGIRSWLYRRSIDACDKVLFVSNRQKQEFREKLGITGKNELTLPLGIDLEVYNDQYEKNGVRKKLGYDDETCIIGYVGRFEDFKRVDKVIKAVAMLGKRLANLRLIIAGFGDGNSSLRSLAASEGVDKLTDFFIAPPNLIEIQQSIDFLVHPSEHESLGLSVLEAMALGKVVIVNNFESAHEIVDNGNDGIILDDITPKAIAETIESLWVDHERYGRIAQNGINKIRKKFDFNVHLDLIITEYEKLCSSGTSPVRQ